MTAFTLVTADVETIVSDSWRLLEPWANLLQIIIGTYLLYRQLGAVCCVPVIVILLTFSLVALVGSRIPGNQGAWFQAVERRIDLTSQTLESLHPVKLLGLSRFLENRIQTKRRDELNISKKFRVTNCLALASAYCPQSLAPLITFGAYSIMKMTSSESNFSVSTAVMSFSILNLISNPAMQLLLTIPMGAQAIGCYGRIQDFLQISESPKSEIPHMDGSSLSDATGVQERKQPLKEAVDKNISAVTLSLQLEPGRIIAITGPSGCGKSLVLREIISTGGGQHPDLSHPGGVAYCSQEPWIFQGTIRDNIVGQSELDNAWYQCVIRSCELDVDLDRMPQGDDTDVGSQGSKLSGGQRQRCAIARALYSKKKRVIFDDVTSALDGHTLSALTNNVFGENGILRSHGISAVVVTHSVPLLRLVDQVLLMNEYGQVIDSGSYEELVKRQEYFSHHQTAKYSLPSSKHDEALQTREFETSRGEYEARMLTRVDDLRRKKGDWSSFTYYLSSMGWLSFFIFVAGTSLYIVLNALSGVWLVWWAEDTAGSHDLGYWLGLYATWAVLITLGMLLTPIFFFTKLAYKASDILHSEMLITALRAPISVLGKTEDTGSLVNRFSQDIRLCDWQLPFNILLTLMASIGIAISAVPYVAIGTPVLVIVLYFLQMLYLQQKAPIVSLFLDTIQGMVAIHAFGWSFAYIQKSLSLLDMSQKPYYLLFCVQRWLILVLALIATGMEIVVIGVAIALRNQVSAGLVGLAVVHVTTLGKSLSDLVMQWTEMETSLGAVCRIYRFTRETPREEQPSEGLLTLPEGWPLSGSVTFESVSATYDTQTHDTPSLALSNITFTIKAGEKVGICGRTGSGKSSLMASLMGLLPCHQGRIFIDGTDISMIAPEIIRCKVNFVTQDPFIFDGTIRENLSPWDNQVADDPMVQALVKVGLWKKVASLGGLDAMAVSHCFSLGERQLFCLARSLLRNSSILILDEPTGHIDPATDATIQRVIRQEFLGQTVIMIAHRLRSLIDFDTVIVLESGHLREIGSPRPLLRDPASAFSGLYHAIESRIDLHCHAVAPGYRQYALQNGHEKPDGMPALPPWSAEEHIKLMKKLNISKSVLSITSPGTHLIPNDDKASARLTRQVNEELSTICKDHAEHFLFFASLPLPSVDDSIAEIDYALDKLGAVGFAVLSNSDGVYLGDNVLDPVFTHLNSREAILFIHPTTCNVLAGVDIIPVRPLEKYPRPMIEFMFDETRAIANLLLSGTVARNLDIKFIMSHCGCALPSMLDRIGAFTTLISGQASQTDEFQKLLRERFFFDLAGFPLPNAIHGLLRILGVGGEKRLVYGTDYPFTPERLVIGLADQMEEGFEELFDEAQLSDVYLSNAASLLGL
ncbi:multidrug resistance-associated [Fusarium mexicanum]|uniref:Multidrug resistance-associated n=1 Tax=Fusarium mexicanum TaxID=751941 RepID=A0A8H5N0L7_9HYPO|nr:multidrug resistance-associated [Fusarium mexicanum]